MSKRLFSAGIAVLLSVTGLTGCGNDQPSPSAQPQEQGGVNTQQKELKPESGAKLVVWESKGPELDYLKIVAASFEKEYGVPVKVEPVPAIDTVKKLTTDGPAGIGADVFSAPHDQLGNAVLTGLVLENDAYGEEDKKQQLPSALEGVSYSGALYGYPTAIDTYALFYNKKAMPQAPKTYEEIVKFAATYNDPANKKFALMWDVGQLYQSYSFLAGYGGYVFGGKGTDPDDIGLNSPQAVEGAKYLQSLKKILPLNIHDINDNIITGFFQEGKTASVINGSWLISSLSKADFEFGVAPLPLLPNGEHPVSFSGIRALYVNSYTKYPDAAKLFATYATSKDHLIERFKMTAQLPPRQDVMTDPVLTSDPYAPAFLEQAKHSVPMPSIPEMGSVWVPAGTAISSLWNDNQDPAAALTKAVEQIKTAMKTTK
ncbi:maltose ABC transporter substrate-binding protein [Paenibacillus sp. UNC499MF]|uniref:sugar ABC transporter substrate-binding protein n=1 Tax=Paenibacillus sp. UNC499MF TaxID=1502751 RepID=UPI0008A02EA7|nr:maltose ABC transporter substrate-binding protein [Paenibacillus sp. UNC499MF]SEF72517.1 arabinogalactan oligomer / maltooligosaccharide transport system substrate-binding protein [Paenibacillus sp. UNC499MF]